MCKVISTILLRIDLNLTFSEENVKNATKSQEKGC